MPSGGKSSFLPTLQEQSQDHGRVLSARPVSRSIGSGGAGSGSGGSRHGRGRHKEEEPSAPLPKTETLLNMHVIGHISAEWLESLKKDFLQYDGPLNLQEFVGTLLRSLELSAPIAHRGEGGTSHSGYPSPATGSLEEVKRGRVGRTAAVVDLFRRVDVHGEGCVTWDEVSNYLIEHSIAGGDSFTVDSIKNYKQSSINDVSKHEQPVEKLVFLHQIDAVACISAKTRGFRLYDPASCTVRQEVSGQRAHRGSIINCCYLDGWNQLATAGADMNICLWDQSFTNVRNRLAAKDVQLSLCGSADSKSLLTGSVDGTLNRWDLSTMSLSEARRGQHKGAINDLLMVEDINLLASASSDGTTVMWDLETMRPKKAFKGHRKGTFSLAYSKDYRCLLTAGLDQEALVWNPYVERVPIFRLKGHVSALCGVAVVPGTPQIISADMKGVFRLWDMRNFRCVQTFGGKEAHLTNLSDFCILPNHRRIVGGGSSLSLFDYMDDWDEEWLTETAGLTDALYNPVVGEFYTCSQNHVRAWSAGTGAVFKMLPEVACNEITACCLAENGRKIFLGDSSGRVAAHSVNNGELLAEYEPHQKDISCLETLPGSQKIFSASWDGMLKMQIDDRARKPYVKVECKHHEDGVTCMSVSVPLMLLATGGSDTQVLVYDLKSLKLERSLTRLKHVVSSLDFLPAKCLLAVADLGGFVSLWHVRPHPDAWRQVYHFSNLASVRRIDDNSLTLLQDRAAAIAVQGIKFARAKEDRRDLRLITADTHGLLRVWNPTKLVQQKGLVDVDLTDLFCSLANEAPTRQLAHHGRAAGGMTEATSNSIQSHGSAARAAFLTGLEEAASTASGAPQPPQWPVGSTVRSAVRMGLVGKQFENGDDEAAAAFTQVELESEVQAHSDGILKLHLLKRPDAIITCGHDRRVRAWDFDLARLGDLLQKRDPTYHFPYSPLDAQKAKLSEAASILKSLELDSGQPAVDPKRMHKLPVLKLQGSGLLACLSTSRANKVDANEQWNRDLENVIADPNSDVTDYQRLFEQLGNHVEPGSNEQKVALAHERLLSNARSRQTRILRQREKCMSEDEASAADRLARALSVVGGDDFGCFSSLAKTLRPRPHDRPPNSAR